MRVSSDSNLSSDVMLIVLSGLQDRSNILRLSRELSRPKYSGISAIELFGRYRLYVRKGAYFEVVEFIDGNRNLLQLFGR